ncbi:hypothetical protein [Ammoniphilus oxalaticus]|nr:hypothetical protein [Ammoniphilus oxalaticus]
MSIVCTEVIVDFPHINWVDEKYVFHPDPLEFDSLDEWAFIRWEPIRY